MRVFIAIEPPTSALEHLEDFLEPRRDAAGVRWSSAWQWHITLAFCGEAPARVLEPLIETIQDAVSSAPRIDLGLAGGGCFPDVSRARVIWAGVRGGDRLAPLARSVRSACATAGAAPGGGPFRPHVTLGRLERPMDATRWVRVLDGYTGPAWTATDVTLVESHLPRRRGSRPRHEILARIPLAA